LHIGGARTALFNMLYARHFGGQFLLRIEDTDRDRSTPEAVQAIFDGLNWLGITSDAEPVFQFARMDRHAEVAHALLAKGAAYRCTLSQAEIEPLRAAAQERGEVFRSPWRDTPAPDGPAVIRFRVPTAQAVMVNDAVQGDVRWQAKDLDDLVILRADGTPTYNLSVVVDDHDMGVTHIIRGDDHLNNAARQSLIYQAMDWQVPQFAHIPLIHGPDGAKLSKRHGAQAVGEFRDMGYLPEAVRNYLLRLGWSHGDAEIVSDDEAIAWFDLDGVGKAPARLDWDKLNHINAHYIRSCDPDRLRTLALEVIGETAEPQHAMLTRAIPLLPDRIKVLPDFIEQTGFLRAQRPLTLPEKAKNQITDEVRARLARLSQHLSATTWTTEGLAMALKDFAEHEGVGMGAFGPALRAALTGGLPAPDLNIVLYALGKDEALARIADALV
jgi:glutamyl-tRNA synthetase